MSIIKFNKNINTKVVIQKIYGGKIFHLMMAKYFFKRRKDFIKNIFIEFKKNKYDPPKNKTSL